MQSIKPIEFVKIIDDYVLNLGIKSHLQFFSRLVVAVHHAR